VVTRRALYPIRVRVDASKCDAQGVCKLTAPEFFELDRYGYAYVHGTAPIVDPSELSLYELAREAEATCPRAAIMLERVFDPIDLDAIEAPTPSDRGTLPRGSEPRLLRDEPETLESWRADGGFTRRPPRELFGEVRVAGLRGQGGAGFPVARKWAALGPEPDAVLVANGAEREPGTVKDAYLLTARRFLVLDGALAAAHDRGIGRIVVAVPEQEPALSSALEDAVAAVVGAGLADGVEIELAEVSRAYVGGEETALLASLEGRSPKPTLRPPFPAERGLNGKPTLVQNVDTLTQVALVNAYGADWFRTAGLKDEPGTGLFSVGWFGEAFTLYERPFGYPLEALLAEAGIETPSAVLAGGYSSGLLAPDQLGTGLDSGSLRAVGARLGTKSIQAVPPGACPLRVVLEVLRFFAAETAVQCPPCHRGLPDMIELLDGLEAGAATEDSLAEFQTFMRTLPRRGLCALPDGAAVIALSYLENFSADVGRHLAAGCPH
jgi:NADH-quinone oxidoreductase subunit F